jgi:beta-lactam-binding protein with PASTA domain
VTLWYSTGLGREFASVPDVAGMTVREAQQLLIENKLRSVVIGAREGESAAEQPVRRQSREPGTRVPEGFEIRLYIGDEEPAEPPAGPPPGQEEPEDDR